MLCRRLTANDVDFDVLSSDAHKEKKRASPRLPRFSCALVDLAGAKTVAGVGSGKRRGEEISEGWGKQINQVEKKTPKVEQGQIRLLKGNPRLKKEQRSGPKRATQG